MIFLARRQHALQPAEKSTAAALRLDVRDRAGKIDLCSSFQYVKSRGTEFPFAANDFAGPKTSFNHGLLIKL